MDFSSMTEEHPVNNGETTLHFSVPVIDISALLRTSKTPEDQQLCLDVGDAIAKAVSTTGVFRISGHGIGDKSQSNAGKAVRSLFAVNEDEKKRNRVGTGVARGYIGVGEESGSQRFEVKEGFSMGYDWSCENHTVIAGSDDQSGSDGKNNKQEEKNNSLTLPSECNSMQGVNVWPSDAHFPSSSRQVLNDLFNNMSNVSHALVKGFSLAMGEKLTYLSEYCQGGETISLLRLFHYFPYDTHEPSQPTTRDEAGLAQTSPQDVERIGSSPHTDWGFLTLIMEPGIGGLQVYHNGVWNNVPPVPGTLICNVGDYFSMLTNGRFVSPLHRVVTGDDERYSIVYFFYPSYDAVIPQTGKGQGANGICISNKSLLVDQSVSGTRVIDRNVAFGEYIASKWEQVSR